MNRLVAGQNPVPASGQTLTHSARRIENQDCSAGQRVFLEGADLINDILIIDAASALFKFTQSASQRPAYGDITHAVVGLGLIHLDRISAEVHARAFRPEFLS